MQHSAARAREPMGKTLGLHSHLEPRRASGIRIVETEDKPSRPVQTHVNMTSDQIFLVPRSDELREELRKKGLWPHSIQTVLIAGVEYDGVPISAKYFRKLGRFRCGGHDHLQAFQKGHGTLLVEYSEACIRTFGRWPNAVCPEKRR